MSEDGAPIGQMLDALGVRMTLSEGQHLVEAVVVGRVVDLSADRRVSTSMVISTSDGLDWIEQRGLLGAATDILAADVLRSSLE